MEMTVEERLKAPFPEKRVSWRIGQKTKDGKRAMLLAYIDARDVMQRLDDVLGVDGWQSSITETPSGRVLCTLRCRINGDWIAKTDGAGSTDVEGDKGAISDALKRAAVQFGIGRYLYSLPSPWVEIDQYGRFTAPAMPEWATPEGYNKLLERRK